ncbi:hypothetical protein HYR99_19720 [Candidatus Poribacteria bacterium]|nr:hypothetical protein [Candidatus Poribacteria bacterium]
MLFELKEGEKVLADVGASFWRGGASPGGRLIITNQRILFEPYHFQQAQIAEIPLAHIAEVRKRNMLGIIPVGILIQTKSGVKYKFSVLWWKRERLIDLIQKLLPKP